MKRVSAKFVPKVLNFDQKNRRMSIAQELLNDVNDDPDLLKRVKTWDVKTKAQLSQGRHAGSPSPQVRSNMKVLLTVFFDCRDVVPLEFFPQVINTIAYKLCARQSARSAWNCGRTKIGFCIMITPLLTHYCLYLRDFLLKAAK